MPIETPWRGTPLPPRSRRSRCSRPQAWSISRPFTTAIPWEINAPSSCFANRRSTSSDGGPRRRSVTTGGQPSLEYRLLTVSALRIVDQIDHHTDQLCGRHRFLQPYWPDMVHRSPDLQLGLLDGDYGAFAGGSHGSQQRRQCLLAIRVHAWINVVAGKHQHIEVRKR